MATSTGREPSAHHTPEGPITRRRVAELLRRVTRLELAVAAAAAAVLAVLVVVEPAILRAPFASGRAIAFTLGGTALAAVALAVMLGLRVPAPIRLVVLGAPFVAVNWWLLSPYFIDEVVRDEFAVTIAEASTAAEASPPPQPTAASAPTAPGAAQPGGGATAPAATAAPAPAGPVLLGSGSFVGLAGHRGEGDAAIFALPDGGHVLRFENFDIGNGPDLRVYLVPGADQRSIGAGAISLGPLRGNVGDQTYDIPAGADLRGPWTALVWCEAFAVEFVGATLELA